MTASVETELRSALAAVHQARNDLAAVPDLATRDVIGRELAQASTSIGRALHLIAGTAPAGRAP